MNHIRCTDLHALRLGRGARHPRCGASQAPQVGSEARTAAASRLHPVSEAAPRPRRTNEGRPDPGRPSVHEGRTTPWGPLDSALAAYARAAKTPPWWYVRTSAVTSGWRSPISTDARRRWAPWSARRWRPRGDGFWTSVRAPGHSRCHFPSGGLDVTALEILPSARRTFSQRGGVADVRDGGLETLAWGALRHRAGHDERRRAVWHRGRPAHVPGGPGQRARTRGARSSSTPRIPVTGDPGGWPLPR